jgi:hypothetical protein
VGTYPDVIQASRTQNEILSNCNKGLTDTDRQGAEWLENRKRPRYILTRMYKSRIYLYPTMSREENQVAGVLPLPARNPLSAY